MDLSYQKTVGGARWAVDGKLLPADFTLGKLLELPASKIGEWLKGAMTNEAAEGPYLAPIDHDQEVWASGVTYLRSRVAREAESQVGDVYQRVYNAERPEIFYKAHGWRVMGCGETIRVRKDSRWNVPEPEMTLVLNRQGEIVGYCAGNDVSSRDIEGENPLYLPQAKVYNGSCALGPFIRLVSDPAELVDLPIHLDIVRHGQSVFQGSTSTKLMKRPLHELTKYLFRELSFPGGVFLMTGTGIVPAGRTPGEEFDLLPGDWVQIKVGTLLLENPTGA